MTKRSTGLKWSREGYDVVAAATAVTLTSNLEHFDSYTSGMEKAFAINAEPPKIWEALVAEFNLADESTYEVEQSITNEFLALRVRFQDGIEAQITYRLIPRDDHTEVIATIQPEGFRYALFRIITMGRSDINYEMILVVGLANLKEAVEGGGDTLLEDALD